MNDQNDITTPLARTRNPSARLATIAVVAALTRDEKRILELFRETTDQQLLLGIAAVCARTKPRHTRPALHLVRGGTA
ncbi:hypothetical protein CR152_10080 [Massilia violaceinigra]|uniref:Uncharacterized protein n=1 Tax=Massilia violaceinigra TaxID=2045208 RepID=A0A2D2DIN5_9BURK|nr:hypothetical protein [Massilia violaceinigra]ATQ74832.1 hypothetical protein CR152_10080 [Massilia violaceinigra]